MSIAHALAAAATLLVGQSPSESAPKPTPRAEVGQPTPDPSWKALGSDIWFDPAGKRLILGCRVVLREGALEHFLCSKNTKEHESILATTAPPRLIHAGLLLTGAEPGKPVRFDPKFEPPTGATIALALEWYERGEKRTADARTWVSDLKSKKTLETEWVFAGSDLFVDPITKEKIYAADDGDLITVANFASSILDLPFRSSAGDADRLFVARTEAIPEAGTIVFLMLKPKASVDRSKKPSE